MTPTMTRNEVANAIARLVLADALPMFQGFRDRLAQLERGVCPTLHHPGNEKGKRTLRRRDQTTIAR